CAGLPARLAVPGLRQPWPFTAGCQVAVGAAARCPVPVGAVEAVVARHRPLVVCRRLAAAVAVAVERLRPAAVAADFLRPVAAAGRCREVAVAARQRRAVVAACASLAPAVAAALPCVRPVVAVVVAHRLAPVSRRPVEVAARPPQQWRQRYQQTPAPRPAGKV
ncbi:MAG: hypothetical protein ABW202_19120, partial [Duganella sp.]